MSKKLIIAVAAFFLFALALYSSPREASAVPAFARQTGLACNTCHFQHYPTLNAYGRTFKAGGYTQIGGQSLVEGDFLSMPSVLNASLVTKVGYQKRNGNNNDPNTSSSESELNKGQLQFPDEAALLIGGRAGEHLGFLIEASLKDGDSRFTSYKMPIIFDAAGAKLTAIPFSTDSAGPSYGLELLNTGALRMQRPLEHRTQTSAQQYIGTDGAATGFTFGAVHNLGFINYTPFYRTHGDAAAGPFLNYFRAAATPQVGGWDLGVGAQWWTGTSKSGDSRASGTPTREHADAWAIDAQAQGEVGPMPLGIYLTYANAEKSKSTRDTDSNVYNTSVNKNKSAWSATGELGVIPQRLSAALGYRGGKNGDPNGTGKDSDNATTVALVYMPLQNLQIQLDHSWFTGDAKPGPDQGNMLTTLMIFAAF